MRDFHKITPEDLRIAVDRLKQMRFFPADDVGMQTELRFELASMCHDAERLMWLTRRAIRIFTDWCGVAELRALYSSRWKPADGVRTYSQIYQATEGSDGYPALDEEGDRLSRLLNPPRPVLQIEAPALPPGDVSADTDMNRMAKSTAAERAMLEPQPEDYDNPANEALYWMERGTGIEDNEVDRYRRGIMARVPQKQPPPPWPEGATPVTQADVERIKNERAANRKEPQP